MGVARINFAWVLPTETVFGSEHHVEDEKIVGIEFEQSEGDFGILSIIVRNPRFGVLAFFRKTWIWLSVDNGTTVKPCFFGRLDAVPDDIQGETVRLQFTARPSNYRAIYAALAETLKDSDYYDAIWIAPDSLNDPDTVFDAYTAPVYINPVTHEVLTSDLIVGEDGIAEFQENEVPRDSVTEHRLHAPLRAIIMEGTVNWTQQDTGTFQLPFNVPSTFLTFTGASLQSNWPKPGANLGNGYSVVDSFARDVLNIENTQTPNFSTSFSNEQKTHNDGDTMSASESSSIPLLSGYVLKQTLTSKFSFVVGDPETGQAPSASVESTAMYVPRWEIEAGMTVQWKAARQRTERVRFTLRSNIQSTETLPAEDEVLEIKKSSVDIGLPLPDLSVPIGELNRSQFFPQDRGIKALKYLVAYARAHLILGGRCVEIPFDCDFERAIDLTLRMNALLHDSRFPGGKALGKIVKLGWSLAAGKFRGHVTMACSIGFGGAVTAVVGTPSYINEGYFNPGQVQVYTGAREVLPAGDVNFSIPVAGATDDGLNFPLTREQVVVREEVHGTWQEQQAIIIAAFPNEVVIAEGGGSVQALANIATAAQLTVANSLKQNAVYYEVELKTLEGVFETIYEVECSDLEMPKQLDLTYAINDGRLRVQEQGDKAAMTDEI